MDKPATDLFVNILVNIGALFRHAPAMIAIPMHLVINVDKQGEERNGSDDRQMEGETSSDEE